MSLRRRTLMLAATAGLARPYLAFGETTRPLRFIPATDVTVLDPHWTPASVTRDHGALVFDTLFGLDSSGRPSPQMLEGALVEDDGRRWALKLRPGLLFHDGEGVLARDCVASITRWARRDPYGQTLMESTDELIAADDRTIIIRLKKPFPQLPIVLGKIAAPIPAMMPERLARTDPFTQVKEMIGSGPYRFIADERIAGVRTVYQRFSGYQPRQDGRLDGTTGAKVAYLERVEWNVIPDSSTAAAAMQTGEQDWWGSVDLDLLPALRRHGAIQISILDPLGQMIVMRHNHLQTPFNDVRIRRALLPAINQQDFVIAVAGNVPSLWRIGVGLFTPGSPMANDAGLSALTGPWDLERARREIAAAGYNGERVVVPASADAAAAKRAADVGVDMLTKIGLNVDYQIADAGTFMQRRDKKGPVDQGGWSCYFAVIPGMDMVDPGITNLIRGNGAYLGWPKSGRIESLRRQWLEAIDDAKRRELAEAIQVQAFEDVLYIPLGIFYAKSASRNLTGMLRGFPMFWNVRYAA